jgi:hypothetical protein
MVVAKTEALVVVDKLVEATRGQRTGTDNNELKAATAMVDVMAMATAMGRRQMGNNN